MKHQFLFLGGDPALDFLNTEIVRDGEPDDLLDSPQALGSWIAHAGLGTRMRVTPSILARAKELRAALRRTVLGMMEGKVAHSAIRTINAELQRGRGGLALSAGERFSVGFRVEKHDAVFLIARAAATFLARAEATRIHRCGGTNCVLFFYDETKSGTRRWCSMAGCGNRMKAALHYQRKRGLLQ